MHRKAVFISIILGCLTWCNSSFAEDQFFLAYYFDIKHGDETYTLQEHGLSIGPDNPVVRESGSLTVKFSLATVENTKGLLVVDVFESISKQSLNSDPAYSLDVDFNSNSRQEVNFEQGDFRLELVCTVVRQ